MIDLASYAFMSQGREFKGRFRPLLNDSGVQAFMSFILRIAGRFRVDMRFKDYVVIFAFLWPLAIASANAQDLAPIISTMHLNQSTTAAHLDLSLSSAVPLHAFLVENPNRLIIDLPEFNYMAKMPHFSGHEGLITAFRYGLFAAGQSRIVMDLTGPVKMINARVNTDLNAAKTARLTVDIEKTDEATFHASVIASQNATPATQPAVRTTFLPKDADSKPAEAKSADDKRPLIVIDPGHGGPDSGAIGIEGAVEKTVVFNFATTLKTRLEATGHYRVLLTRDQDVFVPLEERMQIARAANASLFLSVHADTLSDTGSVSGATVYTVSDKASDAEAARVAAHENQADAAGGLTPTEQPPEVADILFDLTRRETRAYAHVFSKSLVAAWKSGPFLSLNKNPQRSAGFVVLKAPDVPSVLLELGYLSSPKDAKDLVSADWREKATNSVLQAINVFFKTTVAN
eukprot:gene11622-11717_t